MALISLTQYETNIPFYLDDSQIEMVMDTVVNGVTVGYILRSDPHNTGYNGNPLYVTQLSAAIAILSTKLVALNISKTGDQFIPTLLNGSVNHFGSVQDPTAYAPAGANSQFEYFKNGNTMEIYYATETPLQIANAITALGPQIL